MGAHGKSRDLTSIWHLLNLYARLGRSGMERAKNKRSSSPWSHRGLQACANKERQNQRQVLPLSRRMLLALGPELPPHWSNKSSLASFLPVSESIKGV